MILNRLRAFLDRNNIKYTIISHSQAFTAQEIAMIAHIPGKTLAKTVIVKVDGKLLMVVLPATDMVDFKMLKKSVGGTTVQLAGEDEFRYRFPESELGAMPPFGNLYNMDVLVADDLAEDEEIAFNAGSHRELVKMAYKDFAELVQPKVTKLSIRKHVHADEDWGYNA